MPNITFDSIGNIVLVVQSAHTASDPEWAAFMTEIWKHDPDQLRVIVFTDGGGPNTAQRKQITDTISGKKTVCAIVTTSTIVRGVATALSWFNSRVKAFPPANIDDAYRHINATPSERSQLKAKAQELRTRLGDDSFRSISRQV